MKVKFCLRNSCNSSNLDMSYRFKNSSKIIFLANKLSANLVLISSLNARFNASVDSKG